AAEVPAPAKVPAPAVVSAPAEAPTPVGALAQKAAELADAAKRKGLPKLKLPKLFKKKTSHAAKPAEKAEVKTESADVKSGAPGGEAVAPEALSPAAAALVQPVVSPEIFTRGRKRRKPWKTSSMKALKQRCEQGTVYGTDV
ncbi:MAG: hypothetical protein Q4D81_10650, partial [Eubacteriales bacterium]|nr:hypothetical protein [Eubacteriales bacterium]